MSFERDININVRAIVDSIKNTVMNNIVHAVRTKQLTIEENKLNGIDRIVRDAVDQAVVNSSHGLNETLRKFTEDNKK